MGETDPIDYIIIIPLYNEAAILQKSVKLLLGSFNSWDKKSWKIILADNGSCDATGAIGREIAQTSNGRILYFYFPLAGRGNALRETVKKINSKFYLYVDVDIPLPPEEIINFFKPLEEGKADLVVGKRVKTKRPWLRRLLTISLRAVTNLFFGLKVSDALCGIKAMNKKASEILAGRCKENGFILDAEFLIEAKRASLRTKEMPIRWIDKRYSERESSLKMISDPVKALWALIKILYRN